MNIAAMHFVQTISRCERAYINKIFVDLKCTECIQFEHHIPNAFSRGVYVCVIKTA